MVGVLVRLRLALLRRARGTGPTARLWYGATWLLGLLVGGAVGAGVALLLRADPGGFAGIALAVLALTVAFAWVVIPILVPALANQAIDPARLDAYPIPARTKVAGLLAGSLIAPTVLGLLVGGLGGAVGAALAGASPVGVLLAVGAAAVMVVLCVAVSGAVQALLSDALGSRRGRDAVLVLSGGLALLGVLLGQLGQLAPGSGGAVAGLASGPIGVALTWLPPASLGAAMADFADGRPAVGLARTATGLLVIAGAVWGWARVVAHRPRAAGRGSSAARATGIEQSLGPWPLTAIGHSRFAAALYQQWRYTCFRSPAAVRYVLLPMIIVAPLLALRGSELPMVLIAATLAIAASAGTASAFDFDDRGFEFLMTTGAPWRPVLLGKVVSAILLGMPFLVVMLVGVAVAFDRRDELLAGLVLALALALMGIGLGAASSARNPANKARRQQQQGARLAAQFLVVGFPLLVVGAVYGLRSALGLEIGDLTLALALLPIGGLTAWYGVALGARWLQRDPWRVHELLEL
jgi:ABC-2 type transport system permease protein